MDKQQTQHGTLRGSHGFIAIVILLVMFSMRLSSLVLSEYVVQYFQKDMFPNSSITASDNMSTCNVNTSTEEYSERTAVQKAASQLNIYLRLLENLPALITSGIAGGLSDRYGRTRILTISLTVCFLAGCISSAVIYFQINVYYFLFSSTLYSLGGSLFGILSISYAYISDITSPGKQRTIMLTLLQACTGISGAVSGLVSGFIFETVGFFYASVCVSATGACSILVVVLFLPNSHPPAIISTGTSTFENVRASFTFYFRASPLRHKYVLAIITFMIATLSVVGKQSTEILYQLNVPFCWSSVKVGYYSALSNSTSMILTVVIVKVLQMFFTEETIAILSGVSGTAASTLEAFAVNDTMLFLVPVIGLLIMLVFPMIRSMLSKITPPDRQGALFAGISVVEIAGNMGSDLGGSVIYEETVATMRGFVFLVFAGLSFLTTCLLLIYRIINRTSKTVPLPDATKDNTGTQVLIEHEGN